MYVCICNGYRESEIEQTARASGLSCPVAVYQVLGSGPCCGTCLPMAQDIINGVGNCSKTLREQEPLPLAAE
ncbi:MAG: (2Fe-2S)-binding protein [Rhodospirillaceae bacterium]|nr:(2Fe-2S)-binding protein [Rhodospirillaceae bacterium]